MEYLSRINIFPQTRFMINNGAHEIKSLYGELYSYKIYSEEF